ncbi:MAG: hypothetical protein ACTHL8_05215 [Burkholderiaceae bacterium]
MEAKQRPAPPVGNPTEIRRLRRSVGMRRLQPSLMDSTASEAALQLRRVLVLVDEFHSLCAQKPNLPRLAEFLKIVIARARDAFGATSGRGRDGFAAGALTADQARCLSDLELLQQGMLHSSPEASRGLAHAMDALLIQCVLLDAAVAGADPRGAATRDEDRQPVRTPR